MSIRLARSISEAKSLVDSLLLPGLCVDDQPNKVGRPRIQLIDVIYVGVLAAMTGRTHRTVAEIVTPQDMNGGRVVRHAALGKQLRKPLALTALADLVHGSADTARSEGCEAIDAPRGMVPLDLADAISDAVGPFSPGASGVREGKAAAIMCRAIAHNMVIFGESIDPPTSPMPRLRADLEADWTGREPVSPDPEPDTDAVNPIEPVAAPDRPAVMVKNLRRDHLISECSAIIMGTPRRDALIAEAREVVAAIQNFELERAGEQIHLEAKPSEDEWSMMAVAEFLRVTNGSDQRGIDVCPVEPESEVKPVVINWQSRRERLTPEEVRLMRSAYASGASVGSLARTYGVQWSTASNAVKHETYRGVPKVWWSVNSPRPEVEIYVPGLTRGKMIELRHDPEPLRLGYPMRS